MLYQELLRKDADLDSKLCNGNKLAQSQIVHFLDSIRSSLSKLDDPRQYDDALSLFRKWEAIINFDGEVYDKSLDFSHHQKLGKTTIFITPIVRRLPSELEMSSDDSFLARLERVIDPYSLLHDDILDQINPAHKKKLEALKLCREATFYYKQSKIKTARENYGKVLDFYDMKNLDMVDIYYLSWALHGIGNCEYAVDSLHSARRYFQDSLQVKKRIEGLPKLFLYTTWLKMLACNISNVSPRVWKEDLIDFIAAFTQDIPQYNNKIWTMNLKGDANYYIAKCHWYLGEYEEANQFLHESVLACKAAGDHAGLFRATFLKAYMSKGWRYHVKKLSDYLIRHGAVLMNDPGVRKLASPINLAEVAIASGALSKALIKLFERFRIKNISRK